MNKKTLITLAALAASGAAMAQSSVTLYGVADVAVGKLDGGKTNMLSSSVMNNSNSYIGLRGVEDLGGGLKAGFGFEQSLSLEDGETNFNGTATWSRSANMWLGGNWGRIRLGRGDTPSYSAWQAWSLLGVPNYDPVIRSLSGIGGNSNIYDNSLFSYKTPVWGGFSAEIGYIAKGDDANGNSKVDVGLTYVNGPLSAGLAYNKAKAHKANYALGAKYSFGAFTLAAGYYDTSNWSYPNMPGAVGKLKGVTLGGQMNFGAMSVGLDVLRLLKNEYVLNSVLTKQKKYTNGLLEMKYALSKRTFFYGAYLRDWGGNNYSLGVQHRF